METERNSDNSTTLQHSMPLSRWIGEQVTILAETFGEPMTLQRLKVYVADLADLDRAQLQVAFTRARRELKFFPKIAALRELADANADEQIKIECDEAWHFANRYLAKYGAVRYDLDDRPALPPRVEYALRRIGGLWGLNQMTAESRPFMYRDFCEGYKQAPLADSLRPQIAEMFAASQLLSQVKRLTTVKSMDSPNHQSAKHSSRK